MSATHAAADRAAAFVARAAIALVFVTPLIVVGDAYSPFTLGKAIAFDRLADIAILAWLFLLGRGAAAGIRASPTSLLICAFAAWLLVTAMLGVNPARSFGGTLERYEGVVTWLRVALMLLVAETVFATAAARRALLSVAAASGVVLLAVALVGHDWTGKLAGTVGNSGLLAAQLLALIAMAATLACSSSSRRIRRAAWTIAVMLAGGLFATRSHAGWLAFLTMATTFAATAFRRPMPLWTAIIVIAAAIAIIAALDDPRAVPWRAAIIGIGERPLLGWGVENFNLPFDRHRVGLPAEPWFDRAHAMPLDWAIAGGLPAVALVLAVMGRGLLLAVRSVAAGDRLAGAVLAGAVAAKLVYGVLWFEQPITLLSFGLLLLHAEDRRLLWAPPQTAWHAPLGLGALAAIALAWQSVGVMTQVRTIGTALKMHASDRYAALPKSRGASFAVRQDLRLLAGELVLRDLIDHERAPDAARLASALDALDDFAVDAPGDVRSWLLAAMILNRVGDTAGAAAAMADVARRAPGHPAIPREAALAQADQNRASTR